MSGLHSRNKGKRGEREVRDLFIAAGWDARRGQQFAGSPDSPDVIVPQLKDYHCEVKFVENLNLYKAMEQAVKDGGDKKPLVFHRKSHTPWLVTLNAELFLKLLSDAHNRPCQCSRPDDLPATPAANGIGASDVERPGE